MPPSPNDSPREPTGLPRIMTFFRSIYAEGAKVTWPRPREAMMTSVMVIIMSVIIALFLFVVDQIQSWGIQVILGLGG